MAAHGKNYSAQRDSIITFPTKLLIFGNPPPGIPVMVAAPSSALDLPLKTLIAEDARGHVWMAFNAHEYLIRRHGLPVELEPALGVVEAIAAEAGK